MRKTLLAVATLALMLTAFPPASVSAETIPVLAISNNGVITPDHQGGGYQEERCDGQLAVIVADVPGCTTAFTPDHLVGPEWWITIGFLSINAGNQPPMPLTGTIKAHLTHAGGEVDFRCTWNGGTFAGCQIFAANWPFPGATYNFSCATLPGAIGAWGECFHGHY
jgi:hypothetical protein